MIWAAVIVVVVGAICIVCNGAGPDTEDTRSVNELMGDE